MGGAFWLGGALCRGLIRRGGGGLLAGDVGLFDRRESAMFGSIICEVQVEERVCRHDAMRKGEEDGMVRF